MTLPSGGIPRMEVLDLSPSLLTLSIIRLMVKIISRHTVAGKRPLKHQTYFWFFNGLAISAYTLTPSTYSGLGLVRSSTKRFTCCQKEKRFQAEASQKGRVKTDPLVECFGTWWESMSTKQKHLDPGVLPLTRRTFLSSRYAKGSKAFRIDSMVVVGFTFLMIIAVKYTFYM